MNGNFNAVIYARHFQAMSGSVKAVMQDIVFCVRNGANAIGEIQISIVKLLA